MIGLGQILIILVVLILLFGNFPKILKDLAQGIKVFKSTFEKDEEKSTVNSDKHLESKEKEHGKSDSSHK